MSEAELFKTSESGDKGQFLAGDPSFVTSDAGIINGLGLDFEVVYAGSEAALIEAFRKAEENKTPLLGYFYSPQWFLNEVPLVKIDLPPYTDGCDADPENITCDYAPYSPLDKYISKNLEDKAPRAAAFIKNFSWTAEDQNTVSQLHHQRRHDPRGSGQEVGRGERGHLAGLDPGRMS